MANLYARSNESDLTFLARRQYIVSCGRDEDTNHHLSRPHGRDDYHLLYMMEGTGHCVRNGVPFELHAGECAVFLPNEPYEYSFSGNEKMVRYWVHFKGDQAEAVMAEFGLLDKDIIRVSDPAQVEIVFETIIHEIWVRDFHYLKCGSGLLLWMLTMLSRDANQSSKQHFSRQDAIKRAMYHIHGHYAENTDVQTLADICHLSKYRFIVNFKNFTGYTPIDYRNKVRVDQARRLLSQTDLPMYAIAEQLGFQSATYFSTVFKKFTGISPREYILNRQADMNDA